MVGKVTTLKHKVGNDTVERRAGIAKALLTSSESAEVLGSLGDYIVVELEDDAAKGSYKRASSSAINCFLISQAINKVKLTAVGGDVKVDLGLGHDVRFDANGWKIWFNGGGC